MQGTVGSTVLSNGSLEGTDQSDYLRFSVPAGVTVTGTKQNFSGTHLCGSQYGTYYADVATDPFPWAGEGFIRADFWLSGSCQSLGSSLTTSYAVVLQASRGQINIRIEGPGGPYKVVASSGVFGLPAGTFTVRAGTDADGDGILCEAGDFCATRTVTITSATQQNISLSPL